MVYAPPRPKRPVRPTIRDAEQPAEAPAERWAECAGCRNERRLTELGVITDHTRYQGPPVSKMVRCPGSGRPPALRTVEAEQQYAKEQARIVAARGAL